jgi:6-phosphogluconolactonase
MRNRLYALASIAAYTVVLTACGGAGNALAPSSSVNTATDLHPSARAHPLKATTAEFLYTENYTDGNITAYKINTKTGTLTKVKGSPFTAGTNPCCGVVADPAGNYLYAGLDGSGSCSSGSIAGFSINVKTGALTQLSGSPYSGAPCPDGLAITPNGAFLYGTNISHNDSVSAFSVGSNGALTAVPGSPFSTCRQPEHATAAPSGNFLYVSCTLYSEYFGEIDAFTINPSSGGLIEVYGAPYQTGQLVAGLEVLPAGFDLFVASNTYQADNSIFEYSIDTGSGALSEVAGSPFADGDETYPSAVAITPSNRFIYATNSNTNEIAGYAITPSGGGLVPISGSPFSGGSGPGFAAIDSTGNFLYVVDGGGNNITGYRINQSNGKLTSVAGSPFATGAGPYGLSIASF